MLARDLFHRGFARAAARRAPLAAALAILAGLSCHDDPAGPRVLPSAGFSFAPQFSSSAAMVVDFDRVRIVFTRAGTGAIAFDTVVSFPSDADSILLNLAIPVQGVGQSENLSFSLAMINAAGDTVFRGGPNAVTLTAGSTTAPVLVPIHYTGVGANAASVRIATRDTSVFFNDSVVLTAVALDSANQPIAGTPIEWTSLDTARALVPLPNSGKVLGRTQRGPARIRARLVTGQADTGLVRVQPVPGALALLAGNAQSGTVDATLAQPLAVRVTAVDGLGVVGVKVRFTVVSGGGKVDTLVVTDTAGLAAAQLRLGTLAGPDTVRAAVTGLTGSPVTFVATARPGVAKSLVVTVQPGTTPAGSFITPALQVMARDTFGNVATAFTDTVRLAISTNPASGTLFGGTWATAVGGVATFANAFLDRPGVGYVLRATAPNLVAATTAAFTVVPGAPAKLVFAVQPSTVTAGAAITPAVQVAVQDAQGNTVTGSTTSITLAITSGTGTTGAVLGGTLTQAAVAGVAAFADLAIDKVGAGYTLTATATSLTSATSSAVAVSVGAAAKLAFTVQPSTVTAGAAITPAVQVAVQDAQGNTVTGSTAGITLAITSGTGTSGAVLGGTLTQAAVAGVAAFADLAIDKVGAGYTLTATATSLTSAISSAVAVSVGAAAKLAYTVQPSTVTAGAAITPAVQVAVQDAQGNTVTGSTAGITLAITSGTGTTGAVLGGTLTQTAVNGVATFSNLTIDKVGAGYTLTATATGVTGAASAAFDVTVGAPSQLVFSVQPSGATAGAAISPAVVVAVRDALGNIVTGYTGTVAIVLAANPGGATLSGATSVAAVAGVATFTNLSLDRAAPGYTLSAMSAALTSTTSAAFTVTPAAAATLGLVSGDAQSGAVNVALAAPFVVRVRDAFTNPVSGVSVTFRVTAGGGTLAGIDSQVVATDALGQASATLKLGTTAGANTVTATSTGLTGSPVTFTATGTPAPAASLGLVSGDAQSGAVNVALAAPFVVRVRDAFTNPVSGVSVTFRVTAGGGTLAGIDSQVVATDALGQASATLKLGTTVGANTVTAVSTGLTGSPVTFTATASAGAATALVFTTQPTSAVAGAAITPTVVVAVRDALGNIVADYADTVAVVLATNPGGATLSGAKRVAAVAGIATFTGLTLDRAGSGYTLAASATGLTGATSAAFDVTPAAASALALASGNSQIGTVSGGVADSLVVKATDAFGNGVSGVTVNWSTATGSLTATSTPTDAAGVAWVRWTLGAPVGRQTATATATGVGSPVAFQALAQPSGTTHRWLGVSGDWNTAGNWSAGTVPVASSNVFVPASAFAPTAPALSAPAAANDVVAEVGTTITLAANVLTVNGNLDVQTVTATTGKLLLAGTAKTMVGQLPAVDVSGRYTLAGHTNVAGTLALSGPGGTGLAVNGWSVVADSLAIPNSAVLVMQNAADSVVVDHGAWFNGGAANDTAMTAGVLRVRGNLTIASGPNFAAALTHRTVLDGSSPQTVTMAGAGASPSSGHFRHLEIANTTSDTGVTFASTTTQVNGDLTLVGAGTGVRGPGATLTVQGSVNGGAATRLSLPALLRVGQTLAQTGAYVVGTTEFFGTAQSIPARPYKNVLVSGRASFAGATSIGGELRINNPATAAIATVAGKKVTIADSLVVGDNQGYLVMRNPADTVVVGKNARFYGGNPGADTILTAGVLEVGGNVTIQGGPYFSAAGTHRTVLNGTAPQTVTMSGAGQPQNSAHFRHLDIRNVSSATPITLASAVQVNGALDLGASGATGITALAANPLTVVDSVGGGAATMLAVGSLRVGGKLDHSGNYTVGTTEFFGTAQSIPVRPYTNVLVSGRASFTGATSIGGELRINGTSAAATVNGQKVTVTDSLIVGNSNGYLFMTNPADTVIVGRDARFNGGNLSTDTMLTAGALRIRGNVNIQGAGYFGAAGTHRTVLDGAAAQTVAMSGAGLAQGSAHFRHLDIRNYSGATPVSLTTPVQVNGALDLGATTGTGIAAAAALPLSVEDSVGGGAGTMLAVGSLRVGKKLDFAGNYTVGTTEFYGTAQTVPALAYQRVLVTGKVLFGATTTIGNDLTINGSGASATVNGQSVTINDSLVVGHVGGYLVMRNPVDVVVVQKDARFDGTNPGADTVLTAGVLRVRGNFTVLTGGAYFNGAGTHRTVLDGSVTQRVSFAAANVGTGGGHFGDLEILGTATQAVKLLSNVAVQGNAIVRTLNGATPVGTVVDTTILTVGRTATLAGALYDTAGTRWLITNTQLSGTPAGTLSRRPLPLTLASNLIVLGTDTLARPLTVNGKVWLNGLGGAGTAGALVVNGQTLNVSDSLTISTQGFLVMRNSADQVVVNGHAYFNGTSPILDTILTAGVLRLRRNLTVPYAQSFAPRGTHRTVFDGPSVNGVQIIQFPTGSDSAVGKAKFRDLVILRPAATDSVQIASDVYVSDSAIVTNTGGTGRLVSATNGALLMPATGVLRQVRSNGGVFVRRAEVGILSLDSLNNAIGILSPDTIVFRAAGTVPNSPAIAYKSVRIAADTMIAPSALTVPNDLVIGGASGQTGTLALGITAVVSVGGNLRTEGQGKLKMMFGTAQLTVTGNATFAGGSTSGLLTAGRLLLNGNFVQTGASGGQFAPSGTHRASFTRPTGVQTIQFQDSVNSFFSRLDLNRTGVDTVRLLSNVLVNDSAILNGQTVLASTALEALKTPVAGVLDVHSGAVLKPSRVEFGTLVVDSAYAYSVRIFPDTAVFLNASSFPSGAAYDLRHIRVAGGTLMSSGSHVVNGNLVISGGTYRVDTYATDSVAGYLRTEGAGTLSMLNSGLSMAPTLAVRDSAVFAGGTSTLAEGTLRIYGSFVQRGAATSFQASPMHYTVFASATDTQTVSFAAPDTSVAGSAGSYFGNMEMAASGGVVRLLTDAAVQGTFTVGEFGGATLTGTHTLFARGLGQYSSQLTIDTTLLVLLDGQSVYFGRATFRNQPTTATRFWIRRSDFTLYFYDLTFEGAPDPGGYYVGVENLGMSNQAVYFLYVVPAGQPLYQVAGSPLPDVYWYAGSSAP